MGRFRRVILISVLSLGLMFSHSRPARAGAAREILLTSTYGVLAGALVGLASIAFTAGNPTGNLRNIAIGGSVGLYVGIGLGLYVAYGISLDEGKDGEEELLPGEENKDVLPTETPLPEGGGEDAPLPDEAPEDTPDLDGRVKLPKGFEISEGVYLKTPVFFVAPQLQNNSKWGFVATAQIVRLDF